LPHPLRSVPPWWARAGGRFVYVAQRGPQCRARALLRRGARRPRPASGAAHRSPGRQPAIRIGASAGCPVRTRRTDVPMSARPLSRGRPSTEDRDMVTLTVRPRLLSASTLVAALVMVAAASAAPARPGGPGDLHVGTRSATALTLRWHTASGVTSDLRYRVPHRRWTLRHARGAHRLKVAELARDTSYLL